MTELLSPGYEKERAEQLYDEAEDRDQQPYRRIVRVWDRLGRRGQIAAAASGLALTALGLLGGRFLFKDNGSAAVKLPPGVAATARANPGGQAPPEAAQGPSLVWSAVCSDLDVSRTPGGSFVFKPTLSAVRGATNPRFTYTTVTSSPEGEAARTGGRYTEAVTSVRWDSPEWAQNEAVTVSPSRLGGAVVVSVIAFTDPAHQPPDGQVPPEWGNSFPEATSVTCEAPLFAEPDGYPTRIVDTLGNSLTN